MIYAIIFLNTDMVIKMKDFYNEVEPFNLEMTAREYYEGKRNKVIATIEPICNAFGIKNYNYVCDLHKEMLVVEGEMIDCYRNSIGAIVMELINYIWINTYAAKLLPKDTHKNERKQAVIEFAVRLKKKADSYNYDESYINRSVMYTDIDDLVTEVCGE